MNNLVLSLAPKFTKLQTLVLRQDKPQLEDHAVETIASYCRDLQDLDLSKSFKLSDLSLYALAHGCPNLTKLNISGCTAFSDAGLEYLTKFCQKLKILNLCGCVKGATDRALKVHASYSFFFFFFFSICLLRRYAANEFDKQSAGYWTQLQSVAVFESGMVRERG